MPRCRTGANENHALQAATRWTRDRLLVRADVVSQNLFDAPAINAPQLGELPRKLLQRWQVKLKDRCRDGDRVNHEGLVFRRREAVFPDELSPPEVLAVSCGVVKDDLADVPCVVRALLGVAAVQKNELRGKPTARDAVFNLRRDDTLRPRVPSRIVIKKLDKVDVTTEMQTHHGVSKLVPTPVFSAVDNDLHECPFAPGRMQPINQARGNTQQAIVGTMDETLSLRLRATRRGAAGKKVPGRAGDRTFFAISVEACSGR